MKTEPCQQNTLSLAPEGGIYTVSDCEWLASRHVSRPTFPRHLRSPRPRSDDQPREEVSAMRNLDLPSQSWSVDETPGLSADAGKDDSTQPRSFHYGK